MMAASFYTPGMPPPRIPQSQQVSVQRKPSTRKKMPTNNPSVLLTHDENLIVFNILGKGRQSLSTAVVQFLIPSEEFRKWKLQEVGVLCFVRDSGMKTYFLEIISIRMNKVVFSQEIYDEFGYRKPRTRFLTFEGDNFTIGLNFASEEEILSFQTVLDDKMTAKRERIAARQSRIFELQNPSNPQEPIGSPVASPGHQRRTTSFDNRLDFGMQTVQPNTINLPSKQPSGLRKNYRGRNRKSSKPKKKVLNKGDIGLPTDFRVVLHAGFDPDRGYVVDNYMDEKFSKLFHMAGVTDKELEDEPTRDFILDFIEKYEGDNSIVTRKTNGNTGTTAVTPPPPPASTRNSPANVRPPPVPLRQAQDNKAQVLKRPSLKSSQLNFGQSTLPTPTFQNKVTISPLPSQPRPSPTPTSNAPPPPPFPTANTISPPPPPPMPNPSFNDNKLPTINDPAETKSQPVEDERSALMRQIQDGKKLKKVDTELTGRKPGGGLLLDQIKGGVDLKKVSGVAKSVPSSMDGLAGALARALAERKGAINPDSSGSESDEDGDDVCDGDEWE